LPLQKFTTAVAVVVAAVALQQPEKDAFLLI